MPNNNQSEEVERVVGELVKAVYDHPEIEEETGTEGEAIRNIFRKSITTHGASEYARGKSEEQSQLNEAIKTLASFADWGNKDHRTMAGDLIIAKYELDRSNYIYSLQEKIKQLQALSQENTLKE